MKCIYEGPKLTKLYTLRTFCRKNPKTYVFSSFLRLSTPLLLSFPFPLLHFLSVSSSLFLYFIVYFCFYQLVDGSAAILSSSSLCPVPSYFASIRKLITAMSFWIGQHLTVDCLDFDLHLILLQCDVRNFIISEICFLFLV